LKIRKKWGIQEGKTLGKIEEILIAIEPLNHLFFHDTITYHVANKKIDVFRAPLTGDGWRILFHSEKNGICAYFVLYPQYPFIKDRKRLAERNEAVVFSMQNVFRYLCIPYPNFSQEDLDKLQRLSMLIRDNFPKLSEAFSEKKIEQTYNALIVSTGNNEEEINKLLPSICGWN